MKNADVRNGFCGNCIYYTCESRWGMRNENNETESLIIFAGQSTFNTIVSRFILRCLYCCCDYSNTTLPLPLRLSVVSCSFRFSAHFTQEFMKFVFVLFFFSVHFISSPKWHFSLAPIYIYRGSGTRSSIQFMYNFVSLINSYCFRTIKFLSMSTTVASMCRPSISVILEDIALVKWISMLCACVSAANTSV